MAFKRKRLTVNLVPQASDTDDDLRHTQPGVEPPCPTGGTKCNSGSCAEPTARPCEASRCHEDTGVCPVGSNPTGTGTGPETEEQGDRYGLEALKRQLNLHIEVVEAAELQPR